jgi:hypothetical protein
MAIVTKDITSIANKWSQRAQAASGDYTTGVESTQKDWATLTANASGAWQNGVSQAAAHGSFTKGVRAAGSSKWQNAAKSKGAQRYGPGVSVAEPDFTSGFQPYLQTIQALTLPQRQAKGSPANYDRVRAIGTALHAKKVGA